MKFDIILKTDNTGYHIVRGEEVRFAMTYFKAQHVVKLWRKEIKDAKRI